MTFKWEEEEKGRKKRPKGGFTQHKLQLRKRSAGNVGVIKLALVTATSSSWLLSLVPTDLQICLSDLMTVKQQSYGSHRVA